MQAFENVLQDFFERTENGYVHKRCEAEIGRYKAKSDAAAKSAKARWARERSDGNADAMRTHSEGNANHKPITDNHEPEEKAKASRAGRASTRPRKVPLPSDFSISDRVRQWAIDNGHARLEDHFDAFIRKARARGYEYASWDDAFMEAIREDWAGLKKQQGPPTLNRQEALEARNRAVAERLSREVA
jgi:Arc/MetJ-type ribon-helix-helix transcriptional regulator